MRLSEDWRNEISIVDKYKEQKEEYIQLLSELEDMWYGHLGHIKTGRHHIDLAYNDIRQVHSTPYHVGSTARQCAAKMIQKMLQQKGNESANKG